jgi:hypothetical protein
LCTMCLLEIASGSHAATRESDSNLASFCKEAPGSCKNLQATFA